MVSKYQLILSYMVSVTNAVSRYNPIQRLAPQDCISSINGIIDKFDALVAVNNTRAIREFKSLFGLEALTDNRDFAMTIAFPRKNKHEYIWSLLQLT